MVYDWKRRLYPVDAQKAGEFLKNLEDRDGQLKPAVIVEESKPEASTLHPCFEWDDTKAAEKHREEQARAIMRNLVVIQTSPKEDKEPITVAIRAFVNISKPESVYITIDKALSDEDMRKQLLSKALEELESFKFKYDTLVELSEVFKVIDNLKEKLEV